jgi:hypothetical protein
VRGHPPAPHAHHLAGHPAPPEQAEELLDSGAMTQLELEQLKAKASA